MCGEEEWTPESDAVSEFVDDEILYGSGSPSACMVANVTNGLAAVTNDLELVAYGAIPTTESSEVGRILGVVLVIGGCLHNCWCWCSVKRG